MLGWEVDDNFISHYVHIKHEINRLDPAGGVTLYPTTFI